LHIATTRLSGEWRPRGPAVAACNRLDHYRVLGVATWRIYHAHEWIVCPRDTRARLPGSADAGDRASATRRGWRGGAPAARGGARPPAARRRAPPPPFAPPPPLSPAPPPPPRAPAPHPPPPTGVAPP